MLFSGIESVKFQDMVYVLSLDILYSFGFASQGVPVEDVDSSFYTDDLDLFSSQGSADRPASSAQVKDTVRGQPMHFGVGWVDPWGRFGHEDALALLPSTGWRLHGEGFVRT